MDDFFSDSDGEKAVEELLSQAMESTVLEQVAAINCAGFTDSGLPSHLETRFQRLKSFPSSTAKPTSLSTKSFSLSHPTEFKKIDSVNEAKSSDSGEEKNGERSEKVSSTCLKKSPVEKVCLSPSKSSDNGSPSPVKKNPREKMQKKGRKSHSSSSWDEFSSRSVSPPAKSGCFLCSPKKVSRKKNKENRGLDLGLDWGKNDELLSDLSNFSVHSQRKMMKKAMEEEERISREAEKIVKWAKHASARMDVSSIEDELSDDENAKFP
ncbi:UNVERIFIED_CONTAM: hypothetical protein Sradi_1727000 [Sesamum radiatum]|uniref:Hepatoma-derived growth factor-related protein 2-like n=1 Tax=Sesamum radiatum TaxID=300843 RepID=A0AAW2TWQ2_SESRA